MNLTKLDSLDSNMLLYSDWLVTNGLGGFASGSIACVPMRKYHGLLVASLPVPFGRTLMLNTVMDYCIQGQTQALLSPIRKAKEDPLEPLYLKEFRLEDGLPVWRYHIGEIVLEKRVFLIQHQNTLHMSYQLLSDQSDVEILWRPYFHFRGLEEAVNVQNRDLTYSLIPHDNYEEIAFNRYPSLYISAQFPMTRDMDQLEKVYYETEDDRGYESVGHLQSPGYYRFHLKGKQTIVASTEPSENFSVLNPEEAFLIEKQRRRRLLKQAMPLSKTALGAKLILSADQFLMKPISRTKDIVRIEASGEIVRSIIAGFPWFLDWGRDTMISLEGLTLTTGRSSIASSILRTFAFYIKDGLIPNLFPEGQNEGLYHTSDATLWFFHALDRYVELTQDTDILEFLLPKLHEIIEAHIQGTRFGIKVDADGLLTQGKQGYALTWMDAKMGDWEATPRRGKAVEINALWYNALKIYESWSGKSYPIADMCYRSFNDRFWNEKGGYLYDLVDGENERQDASLRPNQLFAISLKYPILDPKHWQSVLEVVKKELLTPYGLKTLSSSHPDYKTVYHGALKDRDAAYHQGTVWPWLLGPFVDVWLKVYPKDKSSIESFLKPLAQYIEKDGLNTIGEIFDAIDPHKPRGCFAQAWSVAEFLRVYSKIFV